MNPTRRLTAIIVDDHPVMLEALKTIMLSVGNIDIVATAGNGEACLRECGIHKPDLVFLDYNLPDLLGSEVARRIVQIRSSTHIVIFTGVDVMPFYNELLDIGVSGIMSKADEPSTIADMIRSILDNRTIIPISVYHQLRMQNSLQVPGPELTEDETEILKLIIKGETLEEIAVRIHVSKRSVDNYLRRAYEKLGARTRSQAIERFIRSRYHNPEAK